MSRTRRLLAGFVVSLVSLHGLASIAHAASEFDPMYRFRAFPTDHFIVYFHQGEAHLAAQLAGIAEETWRRIRLPLGVPRPPRTHVVLVDQTELANGLATPLPYNTIVVSAAWPAGSDFVGKTDDWLRLVFTHEFTHVVHLDRSEGWAGIVRGLFGRVSLAFPNLFLPKWQIEGLATYEESARAGQGRLHAGDFRAIVNEAGSRSKIESLDRVNGGLTDWPSGLAEYAYGAGFHAYLAERFGEDSFARLADATARRLPFTGSRAFQRIYGRPLGVLWREYGASVGRGQRESIEPDGLRRLTHHGFTVSGPRFDRSPCEGCPSKIVYSVRTPHAFPALYQLTLDRADPQPLATRYLGSTSAVGAAVIYFDQQETARNTGLYSDLYAFDRRTAKVTRLTSGMRLLDPDLAPDGKTLVCVRQAPGRRDVVLVSGIGPEVASGSSRTRREITTLLSEPDTQFSAPRWSPDGRAIAVERHAPGHQSEIALVDAATGAVRTIASDSKARFVTPTWRPDGRAIVAAADMDEGPFELYEVAVDPTVNAGGNRLERSGFRQLTHTSGGAKWPDVSPDGKAIVFVGYTVDGFDLFEMSYPMPDPDFTLGPVASDTPGRSTSSNLRFQPTSDGSPDVGTATTYSPWPTLAPTSWSPIMSGDSHQLRLGLTAGGTDVLAYHAYTVSASWLATSPSGAATPSAAAPDWQVSYRYDRWRPTIWLSASADTSFFAGPGDDPVVPSASTLRERQLEGGVLFPIRRVRVSHTLLTSFVRGVDDFIVPGARSSTDRAGWRVGWAINSSHRYGYSISPESGISAGITAELLRQALGSSADASTATVDGRAYISPFARHQVLAIRFAGGLSTGDPTVRRTFHLGGAAPSPGTLGFGRNDISLLRGFGRDTFVGSHVALLNVDYRWPLVRPQRGSGTWPVFLHTVHAAVFSDTGHAWNRTFRARDLKTSLGGELSFDIVAGYNPRLTVAVGAARGRDGSRTVPDGTSFYARFGAAF